MPPDYVTREEFLEYQRDMEDRVRPVERYIDRQEAVGAFGRWALTVILPAIAIAIALLN